MTTGLPLALLLPLAFALVALAALPLALWLRLRSLRRRPPGAPLALPPRSHGQHRRPYLVSSAPASASKPSRPGPQRGYRPPSNTFDADKRHRR